MNRSLVIKYFDGLATPQETTLVEEWLQSAENQRQMEQWLWEDWSATSGSMPRETVRRLRTNMRRRIGQPRVINFRRPLFAAASILIVILTGFALWYRKPLTPQPIAFTNTIVNNTSYPIKAALPDGSTVWLNASAVVAIADDFNRSDRHVRINGEAFFDIKPDPARPFLAESGSLTTKVLGTSFTIEAYPTEKETRISLISGKVAVGSADTSCLLKPGQMAAYANQGRTMTISALTLDPAAWINGKIILNKLALPEALDRLSRLYHISIQYRREQLKEMVITGEFDRNTLSEVLHSVLFVHNLQFQDMGKDGFRIY
jgi:ferric-dicitrate binding protein FerR (iron transport regulator)